MVEQASDEGSGEAAREPGEGIDRDDLRAIPAKAFRDRLEEYRKAVAEPAAQHGQREAESEHGERDAHGALLCPRVFPGRSLGRVLIHCRSGSPLRRALTSIKSSYAYAGLMRTCFFLPNDSLITPSGVRWAADN